MVRTYCVVWLINSWNNALNLHYTNVKIPYGPINLDRITDELIKELNKNNAHPYLEKADIKVVSWNLLE